MYYDISPHHRANLLENSAEHCAYYWSQKRGERPRYSSREQFGKTIEELAPNRFKWAEEWLKKK